MGKLRVFFTIALIVVLLPLNAFGRHKKGDVVQDPNQLFGVMLQYDLLHLINKAEHDHMLHEQMIQSVQLKRIYYL